MKALFLDRDGVINEDYGYVYKKEDFKFKEGIFKLLKLFKDYQIFIVTNQSGIARKYYTETEFHKLMDWVKEEFEKQGIEIIDIEFCPHHPEITGVCECRKPNAGMILNLAQKYDIDLKNSIMIGDKDSDIQAANKAGIIKTYLVKDNLFDIINEIKLDLWNSIKKELATKKITNFKFFERDIFFMSIGQNVGYEQYGKGDVFLRPVIVLKKLSKYTFIGIPLSSQEKTGNFYFKFIFKNIDNYALLNQVRVFDIRRNKYFSGRISNSDFEKLKKQFIKLF